MTAEPARPVRILVVDDHPIVRLGIRQMIAAEPDLTICGEAESAAAARELLHSKPDLAIVDLSLEDGSGLELIRSIKVASPNTRVLVLSMHDEALFAERALRAGARGYIMKKETVERIVRAVRAVLAGHFFASAAVSQ